MFYCNLSASSPTQRGLSWWLFAPLSILIAVFWLLLLLHMRSPVWATVIFLIQLLFTALNLSMARTHYFFSSDGRSLDYKVVFGLHKKRSVRWDDIKAVRLGPAYVRLLRKAHRNRQISLGWVPYEQLRNLKAEIAKEARRLGVRCIIVQRPTSPVSPSESAQG